MYFQCMDLIFAGIMGYFRCMQLIKIALLTVPALLLCGCQPAADDAHNPFPSNSESLSESSSQHSIVIPKKGQAGWTEVDGRFTHLDSPQFSFRYPEKTDFSVTKQVAGTSSHSTDVSCTPDGFCIFLSWDKAQNILMMDADVNTLEGHRTQTITRFSDSGEFDVLKIIEGIDGWDLSIIVSDPSKSKKQPDPRLMEYMNEVSHSIHFGT